MYSYTSAIDIIHIEIPVSKEQIAAADLTLRPKGPWGFPWQKATIIISITRSPTEERSIHAKLCAEYEGLSGPYWDTISLHTLNSRENAICQRQLRDFAQQVMGKEEFCQLANRIKTDLPTWLD